MGRAQSKGHFTLLQADGTESGHFEFCLRQRAGFFAASAHSYGLCSKCKVLGQIVAADALLGLENYYHI